MNEMDPKYVPAEVLMHRRNIMSSRALFLRLRRLHYDQCPAEHKFLPIVYVSSDPPPKETGKKKKKAPILVNESFDDLELPVFATPMKTILLAVSHYYRIRSSQVLGPRQSAGEVLARHVSMYLATELTVAPFADIGRFFRRDHSVVIHAKRKIAEKMETDSVLRVQVATIRKQIESLSQMPPVDHVKRLRELAAAQAQKGKDTLRRNAVT